MRHVRRLKLRDLLDGQFHLERSESIGELWEFGDPDDWRGHGRLVEQPRQRDLGSADAARGRDLRHTFDDWPIDL